MEIKEDHWKRECTERNRKKSKDSNIATEIKLTKVLTISAQDTSKEWVMDS